MQTAVNATGNIPEGKIRIHFRGSGIIPKLGILSPAKIDLDAKIVVEIFESFLRHPQRITFNIVNNNGEETQITYQNYKKILVPYANTKIKSVNNKDASKVIKSATPEKPQKNETDTIQTESISNTDKNITTNETSDTIQTESISNTDKYDTFKKNHKNKGNN